MISCWPVLGQQFSFNVETQGFKPDEIVYLKKYQGVREVPIDSTRGSGKTEFTIDASQEVSGLYFISTSGSEIAEFLVNEEEVEFGVSVRKENLKKGKLSVLNSKENDAYEKFVGFYLNYEQAFYALASEHFDSFDPKLLSGIEYQSKSMEAAQQTFNDRLEKLALEYPNTFTAEVLCPLASVPIRNKDQRLEYETYPSFLNKYFWSEANLSDKRLLNHFLLNESLKNYFRFFVPKREEEIKKAIDLLNAASEKSKEVNNHIKSFLLRNFLNANANTLSSYVNRLSDDGSCSLNLTDEQFKKLASLEVVVDSGVSVPEVILPNRDQINVNLSDVYSEATVTLVLFWSANCIHCREEIPSIVKVYNEFKPQNLEVYAINLDENKFDFRDYLDEFATPWINVTDIGPIKESGIVRSFNIQKTPSLFIVNQHGVVIGRNIFGNSLIEFLQDYLSAR